MSDEKTQLRQSIEERIASLSEKEKAAESRTLCRELLPHIPEGSVVCAYYPMRTEVDVRPLITELLQRGDTVFLPCFEGNKLIYRQMVDENQMHTGVLGNKEPLQSAPELNTEDADIVLVPGRAFDASGNRLGRGNGGYDIWIQKQRKNNLPLHFIGVALECQMVRQVPMDAHDEKLDAVATARGVLETRN
tara:strand:+ start:903 stop:1475 length:573 start_codon:yes stop_codon:yes gene_type:complete